MKFSKFVEHARRIAENIEPVIVADMLAGIVDEVADRLWGLKFLGEAPSKDSLYYDLSEFEYEPGKTAENLISINRMFLVDEPIVDRSSAITGDLVYEIGPDRSLMVGRYTGSSFSPVGAGHTLHVLYNGECPEITLDDAQDIPLRPLHMAFVNRLKADLYAEKSQWDRVGYFRRRFEDSVADYKKIKGTAGAEGTITQRPMPSGGVLGTY